MIINCQENLEEIKKLLIQITDKQYVYASKTMFGATIGQHVRHILEFYQSVIQGSKTNTINYDKRERNLLIETSSVFAVETIEALNFELNYLKTDKEITLEGNFCASGSKLSEIRTSLFRELAYCLEHSIHHQALIKVGLLELDCMELISNNFGLAPATIRYRNTCVQ